MATLYRNKMPQSKILWELRRIWLLKFSLGNRMRAAE